MSCHSQTQKLVGPSFEAIKAKYAGKSEAVKSSYSDRAGRLIRCLLAMFVIMPLLAVALAKEFDFHPAFRWRSRQFLRCCRRRRKGPAVSFSFALGLMVTMALRLSCRW